MSKIRVRLGLLKDGKIEKVCDTTRDAFKKLVNNVFGGNEIYFGGQRSGKNFKIKNMFLTLQQINREEIAEDSKDICPNCEYSKECNPENSCKLVFGAQPIDERVY